METPTIELSQKSWHQINHLALSMEKLASADDIRMAFMEQIDAIIPHKKSFFDLGYMQDGIARFFDPISLNMSDEELNDYYEHYIELDFCAWLLPNDEPVIYRDSEIITDTAREKTTIYKRWMEPMGVYYSLGSTLSDNGILYGSITLFREKGNDFTDEEVYILKLLTEHVTANLSCMYPNGIKKSPSYRYNDSVASKYNLSIRENEIIALVFTGITNKEIADKLFITENTVKKHLNVIFHKLNVSSRTQLVQKLFLMQGDRGQQ